jgi:hypothetical protein
MDRRELLDDPMTAMIAAFAGFKSELWSALPGIIQGFDPVTQTCSIQPAIRYQVQQTDGTWVWVNLPVLVDCPVIFPSGGGATLTFPLKPADECLVIFSQRCIDAWWQSGGIGNQVEFRMLDPSDGFCLPGPNSKPNVPGGISTTAVELRTDDGGAKVSINTTSKAITLSTTGALTASAGGAVSVSAGGAVSVSAGGGITLAATNINITGALNVNGAPYLAHAHSGVQGGPSNTGGVV